MSTQIVKPLAGMSKLGHKWAGTTPKALGDYTDDDEISTEKDGTDGKVSKGMDPREQEALEEAMSKQGGVEEEEEMGDGDGEDVPCMEKSFFDLCETSDIIMDGVNSSPFLLEVVKSIGFSFQSVEDGIAKSLGGVHNDHVDLAKSLDDSFNAMGSRLGIIGTTGSAVDLSKGVGADHTNVVALNKGGFGEHAQEPSRYDILTQLEKSVEDGRISPLELIKFESTGQLSPTLQKSLGL